MVSGRAVRRTLLVAASVCLALGFGINFGKSNHSSYLLASLRALQPELWTRDWLMSTRHYHPLYGWLGALLLKVDPSGWTIGIANTVAVLVGCWLSWRIVGRLVSEQQRFATFVCVLGLCATSGTNGPGGSYVFADVFQPSTLGSLGLLGAALTFIEGRALASGLCLAFAGAFHLNYLLLGLCVFGATWLLGGGRTRVRGAIFGLGPAALVLGAFMPLLMASGGSSAGEEARRILQDVRAPHHYQVATFAHDFVPWVGFQLLGLAALYGPARASEGPERRLLALLAGFWLLILPACLLSSVVLVRAVDQLFAWRLAPHATLLAQIAFGSLVARLLLEPNRRLDSSRATRVCGALGLACLLLAAFVHAAQPTALLALGIAAGVWLAQRHQGGSWSSAFGVDRRALFDGILVVCFAGAIAHPLLSMNQKSDLLAGKDRDLSELCDWVERSTPISALLLSPPEEGELRFRCHRAIVVDWKTTPAVPDEVLQWARRIEEVTGRRPLTGIEDLRGYRALDSRRLEALRAKYGFDVVVARQDSALARERTPDFAYGRFVAYRLH